MIHVVRSSVEGREQKSRCQKKKKKKKKRKRVNTQPTVGMLQITPGVTRGAGSGTRLRREQRGETAGCCAQPHTHTPPTHLFITPLLLTRPYTHTHTS